MESESRKSNVQETVTKVAAQGKKQAQKLAEKAPVIKDKIAVLTGLAAKDPRLALSTWNEGPTKASIVAFMEAVTKKRGSDYIDPSERIAVFDNDGTLWPEKPIVIQLAYTLSRMAEMAEASPELREKQPYKSAYTHDFTMVE